MSTPEPPTTALPSRRRFRPSRRGLVIAAVAVVALVVGGVGGALIVPHLGGDAQRAAVARLGGAATGVAPAPGHRAAGKGAGRGLGRAALTGSLVSTGDGTLVVTPDGAAQRTLHTDSRTRFTGPGIGSAADLRPGMRVAIGVTGTGDAATATTVRVVQARVVGTVTALSGDVATVTSADGLVVPVNVASVNPKPAVGDVITATGTASGPTVTAGSVRILPKAS